MGIPGFGSQLEDTPGALQERSTATSKPELLAQTRLSQGKVCFSGCSSFGDILGLCLTFSFCHS